MGTIIIEEQFHVIAESLDGLTIGQFAELAHISIQTIRYYERRGLLQKPPRNESNYRLYPMDAVRDISYIRRSKQLGFTLREIKQLMQYRNSSINQSQALWLFVEGKIRETLESIQRLQHNCNILKEMNNKCSSDDPHQRCALQELLDSQEDI